eukprot:CAMPEP_0179909114 /NCGR_PEP_ID=MMETSP0982-20121206/45040_1 /TAXON_ID=483367 /ORGANISM="non described non described, Strain CCMP 2436" /LENGTH=30 /DNA_ID= /DNA_START= /DNA_END= /DNA_ORIENTATION=
MPWHPRQFAVTLGLASPRGLTAATERAEYL